MSSAAVTWYKGLQLLILALWMGRCSLDLCRTQKESLRQRKSQQNTFFKRQSTSETKMHILSFGQEPYRCLHCLLMELEGIWLVLLKPPKQFKTFHSNLYFQKSWLSQSNIIHRPLMSSFLLKIFYINYTRKSHHRTEGSIHLLMDNSSAEEDAINIHTVPSMNLSPT